MEISNQNCFTSAKDSNIKILVYLYKARISYAFSNSLSSVKHRRGSVTQKKYFKRPLNVLRSQGAASMLKLSISFVNA